MKYKSSSRNQESIHPTVNHDPVCAVHIAMGYHSIPQSSLVIASKLLNRSQNISPRHHFHTFVLSKESCFLPILIKIQQFKCDSTHETVTYYTICKNKSLKTKFSVRESPFFANVCTKLDYLYLRFKNNLQVKLVCRFQQNIQRRILSRQISIFELKTYTAHYDHSIYTMTVSSQLIFYSGTFVSLLPGPGQKSSVMCMWLCPHGPNLV